MNKPNVIEIAVNASIAGAIKSFGALKTAISSVGAAVKSVTKALGRIGCAVHAVEMIEGLGNPLA